MDLRAMPAQPPARMTATDPSCRSLPQAGAVLEAGGGLRGLAALWLHRVRTRRALGDLHVEQMRETGLDPHALRDEALKPFWRA